jgi:hypothetical protein
MHTILTIIIVFLVLFLIGLIPGIYNRVTYNIIVDGVNDEFQQLLEDNNHRLDYYHIEDFMSKHYDVIDDIEIDLDENNNLCYTLKFRDR